MYFTYLKYTSVCVKGTYAFVPITLYFYTNESVTALSGSRIARSTKYNFYLILIHVLCIEDYVFIRLCPLLSITNTQIQKTKKLLVLQTKYNSQHNSIIVS